MDITRYVCPVPNGSLDGRALKSDGYSTSSQICVGRELNSLQEDLSFKRKLQTILKKIQKEIAHRE